MKYEERKTWRLKFVFTVQIETRIDVGVIGQKRLPRNAKGSRRGQKESALYLLIRR